MLSPTTYRMCAAGNGVEVPCPREQRYILMGDSHQVFDIFFVGLLKAKALDKYHPNDGNVIPVSIHFDL